MTDVFTPEARSLVMSRIRGRDTKPEKVVRSMMHYMGLRFRLHDVKLPGRPDLVLRRLRAVVFVHGCFWHGHEGCARAGRPHSHELFWAKKLDGNKRRDSDVLNLLERAGWRVLVVWECETKSPERLHAILTRFFDER